MQYTYNENIGRILPSIDKHPKKATKTNRKMHYANDGNELSDGEYAAN